MEELNEIFSKNLISLRKQRKITQSELADELGYTDKTISKWETGVAIPTLDILVILSKYFNVSVDYFTVEHSEEELAASKKRIRDNSRNAIIITSLAVVLVWMLTLIVYIYIIIGFKNYDYWTLFIWAVPASCIVLIVFNGIWGKRKFMFPLISILVWSLITSFCLQFMDYNLWLLFLLGVPAQVGIILWSQLK